MSMQRVGNAGWSSKLSQYELQGLDNSSISVLLRDAASTTIKNVSLYSRAITASGSLYKTVFPQLNPLSNVLEAASLLCAYRLRHLTDRRTVHAETSYAFAKSATVIVPSFSCLCASRI